jgi:DNA-directed RNA polymerase subunit RPC12/RpoP
MVIDTKQTTVAYRCPHCGAGVMSVVGVFSLSAEMMKLKCSCGHSEMSMVRSSDGKIRFTVPCLICPTPHSFTVNSSIVFSKELFLLPCPYSDVNIAVMGNEDHVKAELSRSELELLDMLEKAGIDSFESLHTDSFLTDPQVLDIITYVIRELDEEGKITCRCPPCESEESEYDAEILEDGVKVTCRRCGASKLIPSNSLISAHEFLNADSLDLE